MERNGGSTDRIARTSLGALLAADGVAEIVDCVAVATAAGIVLAGIDPVLIGTAAPKLRISYETMGFSTKQWGLGLSLPSHQLRW